LFLAACILALAGCASAPQLDVDMTRDPGIVHEVLPNGMTVWIRPVERPAKTVAIHLIIQAGSLEEDKDQRGVAHLVEHMVFEGGRHFPRGVLDKKMKALGLIGGVHNNAETTSGHTMYTLNVPTTPKALKLAFDFLSDVADGATFPPKSVEQERRVVLAEAVARNNSDSRMYDRKMAALYPGSRLVRHPPIGVVRIVRTVSRQRIMDFYHQWYRPDLAHLVIVGDIDPKKMETEVKSHFSGWHARGAKPVEPGAGLSRTAAPRQVVLSGSDAHDSGVELDWVGPHVPYRTVGAQLNWYRIMIAQQLLQERIADRAYANKPALLSANMMSDNFLRRSWVGSLSAHPVHDDWRKALTTVVEELDRAERDGFTQDEIDEACQTQMAEEQSEIRSGQNETAGYALDQIETAISEDSVPTTTHYNLELFRRMRLRITAKSVTAALRRYFPAQGFDTVVTVPPEKGNKAPTAQQVRAVIARARQVALPRYVYAPRIHTYLDHQPKPGRIVARSFDKRLGVTDVSFANGVRVHIKPVSGSQDSVYIGGILAGGTLQETPKDRGITEEAVAALSNPQTPTRSALALARLTAYDRVSAEFSQYRAGVSVALSTDANHLDCGLRYLHLVLGHPQFTASTRSTFLDYLASRPRELRSRASARARLAMDRARSSHDPRMEYSTRAEVARYSTMQVQHWLDHFVRTAPMEFAIVGDVNVDSAVKLARRYLGSLRKRRPIADAFAARRTLPPMRGPVFRNLTVDTNSDKAAVFLGWHMPHPRDAQRSRELARAARIINERLNTVLRVNKGYVYGASAGTEDNDLFPRMAEVYGYAITRPRYAKKVAYLMRKVFHDFARTGPTKAELQTASRDAHLRFAQQRNSAGRWLGLLQDYDYEGTGAADVIVTDQGIPPYRKETIRKALAEALTPRSFAQVIVRPHKNKSGNGG
jgi:zinc protease